MFTFALVLRVLLTLTCRTALELLCQRHSSWISACSSIRTSWANSPSSHAINQFTTTFVQQYTSFVSAIRSTAYPYHSPYITQQHGTLAVDASFTYNSAPSTLPIFLLTPLTPSKRLHRLLSHAVSQSVNALQAQGDKSTFWLDTSGWLTEKDFAKSSNNPKEEQSSNDQNRNPANITAVRTLTAEAHRQIAEYLADHLCPYLSTRNTPLTLTFSNTATAPLASSEELSAEAACPFSKYDNYLGNLYVPIEADISKMLEGTQNRACQEVFGDGGHPALTYLLDVGYVHGPWTTDALNGVV